MCWLITNCRRTVRNSHSHHLLSILPFATSTARALTIAKHLLHPLSVHQEPPSASQCWKRSNSACVCNKFNITAIPASLAAPSASQYVGSDQTTHSSVSLARGCFRILSADTVYKYKFKKDGHGRIADRRAVMSGTFNLKQFNRVSGVQCLYCMRVEVYLANPTHS
jgi:hypothetical protein